MAYDSVVEDRFGYLEMLPRDGWMVCRIYAGYAVDKWRGSDCL